MKTPILFLLFAGLFLKAGSQQLSLIKDINPGTSSSNVSFLTPIGNTLFFAANDGVNGMELWKSDGTEGGTVMVKDINPGPANSSIGYLTNVNGTLFFVAGNGVNGTELWRSDGTSAGTVMVKDIRPGSMGSNPSELCNVNGILFFAANDGVKGTELWKTDGTAAGTVMVKDINPSSGSAYPGSLAEMNNLLFFSADDGINGQELWKSDGTSAGTVMVKDIWTGGNSSYPANLVNVSGTIFFSANNGNKGIELWKTDGTAAGTIMIKDIWSGSGDSNPFSFKNINGILLFSADNGSNGIELWKSDGTAAGTMMVKDVWPGSPSGAAGNFARLMSQLIFTGNDGVNGYKTWQSDGSTAGTMIATGIANPGSGTLQELEQTNTHVFASITQTETGRELWGTSFNTVLPLQLTEFNGKLFKRDAILKWKTAQENNLLHFIIERSLDGRTYKAAGNQTAFNEPGSHSYSFTDPDIVSLGENIVYYRLKQVDRDGRFTYSNVVALSVDDGKAGVTLYPNPVINDLNIVFAAGENKKLQWQVIDVSGKIVMRSLEGLLSSGSFSINTSKLAAGLYYLHIDKDGFNYRLSFVKRR